METNSNNQPTPTLFDRKTFISTTTKAIGSAVLLSSSLKSFSTGYTPVDERMTVGQVMDLFISEVPGAPFEKTVDTLKAGNRDIKVTGIVTTMFATLKVIQQAISVGANFIIAHEPTFYNHLDETAWLENDDVYRFKANLLKRHNIAVWRNHDYIHQHVPDGVETGVVAKLRWGKLYDPATNIATLTATPLKALIEHAKQALGISTVRYIGNLNQPCKRVLLMPGASGGKNQIGALGKHKPDVLLCGEIQEWETAEYVRDANTKGDKLSLVVLGHIASEEPGSEFMANWLKQKIPGIKVTHIPPGNSLSFL